MQLAGIFVEDTKIGESTSHIASDPIGRLTLSFRFYDLVHGPLFSACLPRQLFQNTLCTFFKNALFTFAPVGDVAQGMCPHARTVHLSDFPVRLVELSHGMVGRHLEFEE